MSNRPLTLDMMKEAAQAMYDALGQPREDFHLPRGRDWCDSCGPREFWAFDHTADLLPSPLKSPHTNR